MIRMMIWGFAVAVSMPWVAAQGTLDWTFVDASRGDRQIATSVHYPAATEGEGVAPLPGPFSAVVFGHGFTMSGENYASLVADLVAADLVVVTVETESGFAPDHAEFARDLAFVAESAAVELTALPLNDRVAIGGHSMGGGATWLAVADAPNADAVFGLAPAETSPSAIASASQVMLPALVLSGESDAVTPPADHHVPIYEQTGALCKSLVTLAEGSHCGYADAGSLCDLGEVFFSGMTRSRQQEVTAEVLTAWLGHQLNGAPWSDFDQLAGTDFSISTACALSVMHVDKGARVGPNPFFDQVSGSGFAPQSAAALLDLSGRLMWQGWTAQDGQLRIPAAGLSSGTYVLRVAGSPALPLVKGHH